MGITNSLCAHYVSGKNVKYPAEPINFSLIQGLIIIEATVNGEKGQFLLDSGAPSLMLNEVAASNDETFVMAEAELAAENVKNLAIQIGSYTTIAKDSWKVDLRPIESRLGFRIDGLIGIDIFEDQGLLIDYAQNEIYVIEEGLHYPMEKCAPKVVRIPFSYHNEKLPILEANYQGRSLNIAFDTGANTTVFSERLDLNRSNGKLSVVDFGALKIEAVPFQNIQLDKLNENNQGQLDGIISASAFNADQIFISFKRSEIYFFFQQDIVNQ